MWDMLFFSMVCVETDNERFIFCEKNKGIFLSFAVRVALPVSNMISRNALFWSE